MFMMEESKNAHLGSCTNNVSIIVKSDIHCTLAVFVITVFQIKGNFVISMAFTLQYRINRNVCPTSHQSIEASAF